jgi:antitoxin VapB
MAILLELSAEVEARLTDKAAGDGMPVAKYVEKLVEEKVGNSIPKTKSAEEVYEELLAIARECHALPTLDHRTADEIIGYDEYGLPS